MELQQVGPHLLDHLAHFVGRCCPRNSATASTSGASALRIARASPACSGAGCRRREHEADRVHAQLAGQAHVAGAGHAAELDAGAEQGAVHADASEERDSVSLIPCAGAKTFRLPLVPPFNPARDFTGRPHARGYSGPRNTSPSGGAVGPASGAVAAGQQFARSSARGRSPCPTSSSEPTMLRTMWCRNALACTSMHDLVAVARDRDRAAGRARACGAWQCTVRKAEKSCSPSSACAARCMASASSGSRSQLQVLAAERRAHGAVEDAVAVAPRARGETRVEIVGDRHAPAHADRIAAGAMVVPSIQLRGVRGASLSKCTTWHCACTPASVRPAQTLSTGASATDDKRVFQRWPARSSLARLPGRAQPLPAAETAAVVFDAQRVPHQHCHRWAAQPSSRSSCAASLRAAASPPSTTSLQQAARGFEVAQVQVGDGQFQALAGRRAPAFERRDGIGGRACAAGMPGRLDRGRWSRPAGRRQQRESPRMRARRRLRRAWPGSRRCPRFDGCVHGLARLPRGRCPPPASPTASAARSSPDACAA